MQALRYSTSMVRFAGVVIVLICIVLLLSGGRLSTTRSSVVKQEVSPSVQIKNLTFGLNVADFRTSDTSIKLILKNGYQRNITAFAISMGSYNIIRDLSENGHALAPGDSYIQEGTLTKVEGTSDKSSEQYVVTLLTVIFDDDTSDGDDSTAKRILDMRLGEKDAMKLILPHIPKVLNSTDEDLAEELERAKTRIKDIPIHTSGKSSSPYEAGRHNAKERALSDIEESKRAREKYGSNIVRLELLNTKEQYEKRAIKQ
ncbi:MAG TPA: hypothetical protein VKA60_22755 [Blastocatellia bacterium]|nr:hypothetical protein [Blastocatellia bacterium]